MGFDGGQQQKIILFQTEITGFNVLVSCSSFGVVMGKVKKPTEISLWEKHQDM